MKKLFGCSAALFTFGVTGIALVALFVMFAGTSSGNEYQPQRLATVLYPTFTPTEYVAVVLPTNTPEPTATPAPPTPEPTATPLPTPVPPTIAPEPVLPPTLVPEPTATEIVAVMLPAVMTAAPCGCATDSWNCSDFNSQWFAQKCYNFCIDAVGFDINQLDGNDIDGFVCESLPD